MKLKFTKMEGIGNDYIYFNCFDKETARHITNPSELSKKLSDRHFGIGGDGIILILPTEDADCQMRMFNADGSEAEMCGNGIRCVAKFVYDKGIVRKNHINVKTGRGILNLELFIDEKTNTVLKVKVNMGEPILEGKKIPVNIDKNPVINQKLYVDEKEFEFTSVSMGNPHCIIFVDKITDEHIFNIGPKIENHSLFPKKVNVEFVQVISDNEINMRVWERGSGETLACGTGSSAVCVASSLAGKTGKNVLIHLLGGDLELEWADDNHVYKTGPAKIAFEGELEV